MFPLIESIFLQLSNFWRYIFLPNSKLPEDKIFSIFPVKKIFIFGKFLKLFDKEIKSS